MDRIKNALKFYYLATELKYVIRTGWDKNHWNISKERVESIAEHVYGTCILAISISSELEYELDLMKVIKMLVIHEIGEVFIGDITPYQGVTKEQKHEIELQAVKKITNGLIKQEELVELFLEFDEGTTPEAKFAYHCDKLEADLQSKYYQDNNNHHDLNNQENNIVMTFDKTKKMLDKASTPFDIWYEYDKSLYDDDPNFRKVLDCANFNDVNELKKQ